jgi:hypothetical protein
MFQLLCFNGSLHFFVPFLCISFRLALISLTDGDHQIKLGVTWKAVDVRLTIRSVLVQCSHCLLILSDDHDVRPNVEFFAAPRACELFGTHLPPYMYEIPTFCTLGVRPAMLSLTNCRKIWSKQPGSSWAPSGRPGRQVPPIGASPENPELAAGRSWIVEHSCVLRDKLWTCLQNGRDLFRI